MWKIRRLVSWCCQLDHFPRIMEIVSYSWFKWDATATEYRQCQPPKQTFFWLITQSYRSWGGNASRKSKCVTSQENVCIFFNNLALVVSWILSFVRAENGRLELENRNITVYCAKTLSTVWKEVYWSQIYNWLPVVNRKLNVLKNLSKKLNRSWMLQFKVF